MKKITLYRILFFFLVFTGACNAQLADFVFNVEKTDETCRGNGTLTFSVTGTAPDAVMLYKVYRLPNQNDVIAVQSAEYLGGLTAANYKIVAVQSFGSFSNTQEKTVTITNKIGSFNFSISSINRNCEAGGGITLSTDSGTISECEIIAGPVRRPRQSSNVFSDLPAGTYNVRAFNECGQGKVKSFTLSVVNSSLKISEPEYGEARVCDSIQVFNTISSAGGPINYPLTVKHTISAMDITGHPVTIEQYFATGDPDALKVSAVVARPQTDSYSYEITVIDNCNKPYAKDDNLVDPKVVLALSEGDALCAEKFLTLNVSKFTGSYTVRFIEAPVDFKPEDMNSANLGPFTEDTVQYGDDVNSVPFGNYVVEITDSCGRTDTQSILIEFVKPKPTIAPFNNGCFSEFGGININVVPQRIVSATLINITGAPADYIAAQNLPKDLARNINGQGRISLRDLPLGSYTIKFTDDCGFEYEHVIKVPEYKPKGFNIAALPACEPHVGSLRFRSGNGKLAIVKVIAAPASFGHSLPYDVTSKINAEGDLYMANLPEGTYKLQATDECGESGEKEVNVEGYIAPVKPYKYTPRCGSFSVQVTDESNGLEGATYWLQKFFPDTNTWGHPQTRGSYTEGDVPTASNAIRLYNNASRNNLAYSGDFRIIKKFETFGEGTSENRICINVFDSFHYTEGLTLIGAYSMDCENAGGDVALEYTGNATKFRISKKNGANFAFDNGASNIFRGLEPAEYVFVIENDCGDVIPLTVNVGELPTIKDAQQPMDMVMCVSPTESFTAKEFNLAEQTPVILGALYSSMYTVTYHASSVDAATGTNALSELYTNKTNGQDVFARLVNNHVEGCYKVFNFKLFVGKDQQPQITTYGTICNDGKLSLVAASGFDHYEWSTGETTRMIYVTEPGEYSVTVSKKYGNAMGCPGTVSVTVTESFTPQITKIETTDWTEDNNTITVFTSGEGNYEYSLDGVTYQEDNVFLGLGTGVYNVYVKDKNGCGVTTQEVVLLFYPNYFTPNGDGQNDKWRIKYSFKEPNFKVAIFDRYGKLITTLMANSDGWDGTLNGVHLPSTDYWFVATREDGREFRGHFAMMR